MLVKNSVKEVLEEKLTNRVEETTDLQVFLFAGQDILDTEVI